MSSIKKSPPLVEAIQNTVYYYLTYYYYWIRQGTLSKCPYFKEHLHTRIYLYAFSRIPILWSYPHYRNKTFQDDLLKNFRNLAIPGTCIPLSIFCFSKYIFCMILLLFHPWIAFLSGFYYHYKTESTFEFSKILVLYKNQLLYPQDWFTFWFMNCTLASLHSLKTKTKGYLLENKWNFLIKGKELNLSISPYLTYPSLVIKDLNEEGGMGIHVYKNALNGGKWIIQEKLENSSFLNELLPENAPLSTFRIMTCSRGGFINNNNINKEKDRSIIKTLSCIFRAGLNNALTDHESILFDVNIKTGIIGKGSTTTHWYKLGINHLFSTPLYVDRNITKHPNTGIEITGQKIKEIDKMIELVEDAHFKMLPDVTIVGWDVALCKNGIFILEVNLSCNFFRADFDQNYYLKQMEEYFLYLENSPFPKTNEVKNK